MTLAHLRPYRALRVAISVARVLPRYLWLMARSRLPGHAGAADDWDRAHAAAAGQLRDLALDLAGGFTKAAQVAGARADILPAPFIDELSQFHDAVPPRPLDELQPIVERELGRSLSSIFPRFEPAPIGAASLAQVHRAALGDGTEVVVKIQYPEIRRIIPLDMGALRLVVGLVRLLQRRIDLRSLAIEVARFVELELDFRREVESMRRLGDLLASDAEVVVPSVHADHCSENVIVMEYLDGIQVTRVAELEAAGHQPAEVARKIGALYGSMIFEHGFFQADPHPGNLLVLSDGRIGLLDYGLCKQLPAGFASGLAHMITSALTGDADQALEAAEALGFDIEAVRPDHLRSIFLLITGAADGDHTILDIFGSSRVNRIPEDFALVVRTMLLLNGLSHRLAPGRGLIQAELLEHLATGATRGGGPEDP